MSILIATFESVSLVFLTFFLDPAFRLKNKMVLFLAPFVFLVIRLFFYQNNLLFFILNFLFVLSVLFFSSKHKFSKVVMYSVGVMVLILVSRTVVASWDMLFAAHNLFNSVVRGFDCFFADLASYLIAIFIALVYRLMYVNLKKVYSAFGHSRPYLILVDASLLMFYMYFYNKFLRYIIKHSSEISTIENLNLVFFVGVVFWLGFTMVSMYVIDGIWLSNERFTTIKTEADQDPMTGVYNRRSGLKMLNDIYIRNKYNNTNFVLCFIDVNNLKIVNDRYGHAEGDRLIMTVAHTASNILRSDDFIIRYGGDEFVIVFQNCGMMDAQNAWSRIVAEFENINLSTNSRYRIAASAGFASYKEHPTLNLKELIDIADSQMYKNKRMYKSHIFR